MQPGILFLYLFLAFIGMTPRNLQVLFGAFGLAFAFGLLLTVLEPFGFVLTP